ncbi:hypothetical protein GH714_039267 [Hevea brasiliensis]|uniref:ABC transporter domain-containing protein n=1 Tax=Hevea brasiliensis TaxID=3981 RepID=A0A6A6LXC9_HEVBR|nr:hypothetical protein GH714_039267 [Hevea brasiliensis]
MEGGDITSRVSSARLSSSNIWRNTTLEVFSKSSSQIEDDEEALKWAALEKLPTYLRVRRGILTEEGQSREIEVNSLGLIEKRNLLERLVKIAEQDNEKFLLKLKDRIEKVGLDMPTIEVRFEHLSVETEAYVGSRALPTMFNFSANMFEGFLNYLHVLPSRKKPLSILNDVSGIIKPRRMTLLLGPPSSGKTTLLLALAGKLGKELKFSGRVTYNGHGMGEFVPQRTSAYISQYDLHIGEMTVRETLAFSARCQGVGIGYEMLAELARREKAANIKPDTDIDIYMKAAALEGQEANVVTDYILKVQKEGVADFLQEVTSKKDQEQYWAHKDEPYSFVAVKEFAEAFQSFHVGRKLGDELAIPFDKTKAHPDSLTTKKSCCMGVMTYYVIGFDPNIGRFFKQYLILLVTSQMASAMFRLTAALGRSVIVANTVGSFALLAVLILGGFIISRDSVKKWWIWGYWFSPMMYVQNGISVNEFLGNSWNHFLPNSTEALGVAFMKSRGLFPEAYWPQALISEEAYAEKNAAKIGESIELSSKGKSSLERGSASQRSASSRTPSTTVSSFSDANQNRKRGMILPFQPLSITFDEVRYAVDMPQEMKAQGITEDRLELLKGVSGAFRPGVLTAPNGC